MIILISICFYAKSQNRCYNIFLRKIDILKLDRLDDWVGVSHKFTSQTTITHWEVKLFTFIYDLGDILIWASPRLLEIIHSWSEDIIEEIRRSIADESKQSKENNSKSSASKMSTRSNNPNWEQYLRDLFEKNKAVLISDIDKSIFIEDFGSVFLRMKKF